MSNETSDRKLTYEERVRRDLMSTETSGRKLTYKERLRRDFTGKGLVELFASAAFMFVVIFCINAYRDGMPSMEHTFLMIGVFTVVWPVMTLFWLTLGYGVDKVRGDTVAQDDKDDKDVIVAESKNEDEVTKVETEDVTLKASSESDKAGEDRV